MYIYARNICAAAMRIYHKRRLKAQALNRLGAIRRTADSALHCKSPIPDAVWIPLVKCRQIIAGGFECFAVVEPLTSPVLRYTHQPGSVDVELTVTG